MKFGEQMNKRDLEYSIGLLEERLTTIERVLLELKNTLDAQVHFDATVTEKLKEMGNIVFKERK